MLSGMANGVDLDQTAPSESTLFVKNFGVHNFRTFTIGKEDKDLK